MSLNIKFETRVIKHQTRWALGAGLGLAGRNKKSAGDCPFLSYYGEMRQSFNGGSDRGSCQSFSRSAGHFPYTGRSTFLFFVRAIWHTYNACNIQSPSMKPFLILLASFLALPACAGVYKWTDAQGRIHYSDSPPLAAKTTQLRLQSFTGPAQVSQAIGADSGVTLYTTEWCGVCRRAKAFFKQNGVPFREWDVEKTEYGAVKFRQLGGSGVPLITVGSEKMMGFDANRFMALWNSTQSKQWPPANP